MKKDVKITTSEISDSLKNEKNGNWSEKQYEDFISKKFANKRKSSKNDYVKIKPFIFDENDRGFISINQPMGESITNNFSNNFFVVGKIFLKKFFTSGTLLIFLVIPMFIGVFFLNNLSTITRDYVSHSYMNNYAESFITSILFITILFIPIFITELRSQSLIKRLGLYGISKEQFNITITSLTLVLSLIISFIIFFPLTLIGHQITESILKHDVIWKQVKINWLIFIPLFVFMIISFTQIGLFLGMKFKGTTMSTLLGYLMIFLISIFTSYQQGGLPYASKESFNREGYYILYEIFRWAFLISPITIIIQGIMLLYSTDNDLITNPQWFNWVIPLAYLFSVSLSIIPFMFSKKWIQFSELK